MASGIAPPRQPSSIPPLPTPDYDHFIEERLARTQRQVKAVDIFTRLVGLGVATLFYLLVAAVLDHWVVHEGLGFFGRLLLWLGLVGGGGYYFVRHILPLMISRVNPVFAAFTIEQSRPSFKNSLINFLFLRRHREEITKDELAKRVYRGLEHRTAVELTQVSVETAVDRTPLLYLSYALAGLVTLCCLYLLISPKNPLTSFERVIWPWARVERPTRVAIDAIEPGDAAAYQGETVVVSAEIHGLREGEPVRLIYSTADGQTVEQAIPMTVPEGGYRYRCEVPPGSLGLQQNIEYCLAAGDNVTRLYKIEMQVPLSLAVDRVEYRYPAYTGLAPQTAENQGDLRALEGTQVTIHATANQPIAQALIEFDGDARNTVRMESHGKEATVQFTLRMRPDKPTEPEHTIYQLRFTDPERRTNLRPIRHTIAVIPDLKPEIDFVDRPKDNVQVSQAGSLDLKIQAKDPDFGLRRVLLHAERDGHGLAIAPLLNKPAPEKALQKPFEGAYRFEPAKLGLKPGDKILYWAEALDNKEDAKGPAPNVAETTKQTIVIAANDQPQQPPKPGEKPGQKQPQDNANRDGQRQNADDPGQNDKPQENQGDQPKPGDKSQDRNDQQNMNPRPENQEPGAQGNQNPKEDQGQQPQKGSAGEDGNQKSKGGESSENQGAPKADANPQDSQKSDGDQGAGAKQGGSQGTQESGANAGSGAKNSRSESQANKEQGGDSAGQDNQPVDGDKKPGDAMQRILDFQNQQEQRQGGEKQTGEKQGGSEQQNPEQQTGNPQPGDKQGGEKQGGEKQTGEKTGDNQPGDKNQTGTKNQDSQKGMKGQKGAGGEKSAGGEEEKQSGDKGASGENQQGPKGGQNAAAKTEPGSEDNAPGENSAEGSQPGEKGSSPGKSKAGNQKGQNNEKPTAGENSPQENPQEAAGEKQQNTAGKPGEMQRAPDNTQAGSEANAPSQKPDEGKGAQTKGPAQGQQEKPEGTPGDPNAQGGNPQANVEKSGSGTPAKKANPTPSGDEPNEHHDIKPGEKGAKEAQSGDEAASSATKRKPSDSQSDTEGDRDGGGGQGDGQKANQKGTGKPGSNTTSEQGDSRADAQGKGEAGSKAGNQSQTNQQTGQPGSKGPGQGTASQNPGEKKTGGDNAGDPQGPPKPEDAAAAQKKTGTNEKGSKSDQPASGKPSGTSDGPPSGTTAGNPSQGGRPGSDKIPDAPVEEPRNLTADDPNLDYARRQTSLALQTLEEELAKNKPELLERLGWSKSDAEKFLQQWQQMMRDAKEQGPRGDAAKKELQNALKSLGFRPRATRLQGVKTQADTLRQEDSGRFAPPAEWAEQFRAYTKGASGGKE